MNQNHFLKTHTQSQMFDSGTKFQKHVDFWCGLSFQRRRMTQKIEILQISKKFNLIWKMFVKSVVAATSK